MIKKLRGWFLTTFTGHYYDQVEVNGKVHRFPRALIVHGDRLQIDFLNVSVTFENRWGNVTITTVDTA